MKSKESQSYIIINSTVSVSHRNQNKVGKICLTHVLQHDDTSLQRMFCVTESTSVWFHVTRNKRYVLTNSSLLVHGLRNNLKWLQPLLNMFVFDPMYAYFLVIVVPNHEIMIRQETYVSCDETEMSLQEGASNTLNAVFINKECYCIKY